MTQKIGTITHYFGKISVAVIELNASLKVGTTVLFKGATTDFTHKIDSMQINHNNVDSATKDQSIGLKINEPVRKGDEVFLEE